MANNVENLEFKELSEIPVTENIDGFYAIGINSEGDDKAYPLDNLSTKDEVTNALKNKADNKDLQTAQTDINSLKSTKADKTDVDVIKIDVSTIESDIIDLQNNKLDKSELQNLQIAIKQYKSPVNNISDLPSKDAVDGEGNPINEEGDGRKVINDKNDNGASYIWVWNGTIWSRTPFTELPSDVARKGGLNLTTKVINDTILSSFTGSLDSYSIKGSSIANDTGVIVPDRADKKAMFFATYPNQTIRLTKGTLQQMHYYDKDFNHLSTEWGGNKSQFVAPVNCFIVGFVADIDMDIKLLPPLEYTYSDGFILSAKQLNNTILSTLTGNLDSYSIKGYTIDNASGGITVYASKKAIFFAVHPNQEIQLTKIGQHIVHFYDKDMARLSGINPTDKFTTPNDCYYVGMAADLDNDIAIYSPELLTQNDILEIVDNAINSNINKLTYCEFVEDVPSITNWYGNYEIKESSNDEFANALFFTPTSTTEAGYIFTKDDSFARKFVKEGDNIRSGFWVKINSATQANITVYGLYHGFNDTIAENNVKIKTNEWVFIQREQVITSTNITKNFRCGFYLQPAQMAVIDLIEITALHLYVNSDLNVYVPFHKTILQQSKEYTDSKIESLSKFQAPKGANISRFLAKAWSKHSSFNDTYRQPTIKVSLIADSIGNSLQANANSKIENILASQFPNVQFEYNHCLMGGTAANNMMSKVWEIINWNPDLVIYGEWESYKKDYWDRNYWESIIRLIRNYTQADIALFAHSIVRPSAEFLEANDIQGYLTGTYSQTHRVRSTFMAIAKKYNCEFMDFQQPVIVGLLDGTYSVSDILNDFVHPTVLACNLWAGIMKQHFVPIWEHESYAQVTGSETQKTYYLQEVATIPDITEIKSSGSWENSDSYMLKSNADNSTIGLDSENVCGWELAYKNNGKSFSILIDEQNPSDIISQYATFPSGNIFAHISKVSITGKVLTDSQFIRDFKLKIKTVTRDANANLTGATFDLIDASTNVVLQADCSAFTDTAIAVGSGQIIISYRYAGARNIKDSGYDANYPEPEVGNIIKVGDEYTFSVKKNCADTITPTNDNSVSIVSIFPLKRGKHTIKITATNGTILDCLMEY